jgi:seryl-tRNA synthetase
MRLQETKLTKTPLQDDNKVERTFHPDGLTPNGDMTVPTKGVGRTMTENILSHHEVMYKLDILEMERGAWISLSPVLDRKLTAELSLLWPVLALHRVGTKVAGHRGFYLTGDGVDLNQAMITYGLDYLRTKGFKKVQPPFFMNKPVMAKTAQLSEFDEALYKVRCYLSLSCSRRETRR